MKNFLLRSVKFSQTFLLVIALLLISVTVFAQPPNDNCAGARLLTSGTSCNNIAGTLINATSSALSTCGSAGSPDVFYSFVAKYNEPVITLNNVGADLLATNPRIQVLTACGGTNIICGVSPLLTNNLVIGTTYIIRVTTNNTFPPPASGTFGFDICVTDRIQIDYSKSYTNVTDGLTGGTINPGDVLEIRATFVIGGNAAQSVTNISFFDTLRFNNGLDFNGPLASRTNEGKIYRTFTTAPLDDAGSVTSFGVSDTAIRINLGLGATAALGGTLSSSSRPNFFGNCIIMATYRLKVGATFGTKINIGGGRFGYSIGSNNYSIAFPRDSIIVSPTLTACSDAVSPENLIGSANNGTFGAPATGVSAAGTQNGGAAAINTTYGYQNMTGNSPQDYFYARANNTSGSNSINQVLPKPGGGDRVFGVWDITGDHTGAINPAKGNKPCNPSLPVSATNPCGYLLAINAAYRSDVVFEYDVTGACSETFYEVSAWFKNICYKCGIDSAARRPSDAGYIPTSPGDSSGVRPNIAMKLDGIHYYTTGDLVYQGLGGTQNGSDTLNNWVRRSFVFKTGVGQTNFKITFANNAPGGGGNDWAIDDIQLRTCYPDMIYAPPNPIAFFGSPLTLSDTIRSYFDNYRHYKWQRRPETTGIWADIPGEIGVGTPVLAGSTYDYIVYYTIPGTATQPLNSGDLYRVVVASNLVNLSNGCNYSPDVSFGLFPVNAPCKFEATNKAIVPENTTINWNNLDWSLGHIPTCCESAEITYASAKAGVTLGHVQITNDICIINLTLINSSTRDLQLFRTVLNPTFNMYMRGNVRMQAVGNFVTDSCVFIARGNNTINVDGNTEIGKAADNAISVFGTEPSANAYVNYLLAGDSLTINRLGFIGNKFASVRLNPTLGTAVLVNNTNTTPFPNAVTFDRLIIGNSNARTVRLAGSNLNSFLNDNGGYLEVTDNSTLIMPANYTLNARDFITAGTYNSQVFLRPGSNLNIGGSLGGITGSNFPRFFNSYNLNATSTVFFNGTVAQTIPGVLNNVSLYGNITLGGTGLKTASNGNTILAGSLWRRSGGHTFAALKGRFTFTSSTALQRYFADAGTSTTNFYDLTNNNTNTLGLSIDSTIGVLNQLQLNLNSRFTLNTGDVIMKSSDSLTAHVANLGTTIPTINYNTTYRFQIERYLYGEKSWRFLATPVLENANDPSSPTVGASWRENNAPLTANGYGTAITGLTAPSFGATGLLDHVSPFPSMKYYNYAINNFIGIADATNFKLSNAEGYMLFVRGDRGAANVLNPSVLGTPTTLRMKGRIRTADQSFTIPGIGVQSIGNPYAAQINFASVTKSVGVVNAFTIWDPRLQGAQGVGGYQNYVLNGSNYTLNGLAAGAIRNNIESGEAFFIQTNTAGAKTITIKEADKGILSNLVSRQGSEQVNVSTLEVELAEKNSSGDKTVIDAVSTSFDAQFSSNLDNDDAVKFINARNNLFIPKSGRRLVVEKRPTLSITDSVHLGFSGLSNRGYQFKVTPFLLTRTGLNAYMLDRFHNKEIELSLSSSSQVDFEITSDPASRAQNRFSIIFKKSANNLTAITATRNADKTVTVKWGVENESAAKDYVVEHSLNGINFTALGNKIPTDNAGGDPVYEYKDETATRSAQWYRVIAKVLGKSDSYTAIASVLALPEVAVETTSSIAISPNPIVGNTINLSFKNMPVGNYDLKIANAAGQVMFKTSMNIQVENVTKTVNVRKLAAGIYQAIILDERGRQHVLKLFVP